MYVKSYCIFFLFSILGQHSTYYDAPINPSTLMHILWRISTMGLRHVYCFRAVVSLGSRRHGGMDLMTGVLQLKDADSSGRTGRGNVDEVSPSTSRTAWSTWKSAWGMNNERTKILRYRTKRSTGLGDIIVGTTRSGGTSPLKTNRSSLKFAGSGPHEGLQLSYYLLEV